MPPSGSEVKQMIYLQEKSKFYPTFLNFSSDLNEKSIHVMSTKFVNLQNFVDISFY